MEHQLLDFAHDLRTLARPGAPFLFHASGQKMGQGSFHATQSSLLSLLLAYPMPPVHQGFIPQWRWSHVQACWARSPEAGP